MKTLVKDIMASPVEFLEVDGEQRLIGLVTHRKLLGAWVSHGDPTHERPRAIAREIPVDMLMETDVVTIAPDAPAADAARIIEKRKVGCLPVVDQERKLVGIVTEADFVRFARKLFEALSS
jgi:CBS domain-containing protein